MNSLWDIYRRVVTVLVKALALCSGLGVLVMMAVTCGDIIGRKFGHSITGAVDIVQVAACIAAICALPYTTAVKGHIAVEVFSQKFPRPVRAFLDGLWRIAVLLMYAISIILSLGAFVLALANVYIACAVILVIVIAVAFGAKKIGIFRNP